MNIKLIYKLNNFYVSISDSMFEYSLCVWIHTKFKQIWFCALMTMFEQSKYNVN